VGALRRAELLTVSGERELLTHPALIPAGQKEVYEAMLQETLRWLKPDHVRVAELPQPKVEFVLEALLEELRRSFPQTTAYLKGGLREILKDYLKEVPWQGPLLSAHFSYLPVFLKRKYQDAQLYLIAQKEWLWSYLSFADFGFPPPEAGRLVVNPSLQSLYTETEVREVGLFPGLTVFYYNYAENKLCEFMIDMGDAAIVDCLQEDRKFTRGQLLDQLLMAEWELSQALSRDEWEKKVLHLQNLGVVISF